MARFRLIAGMHGTGSKKNGTQKVYKKGDIITTDNPIEITFFKKYPDKYQPVPDALSFARPENPLSDPSDDETIEIDVSKLDGMTVIELKQLAGVAGIDLGTSNKKNEIIAKIKSAIE